MSRELSGAHLRINGEKGASDQPTVVVGPDQTLELRALVTAPEDAAPKDVVNIAFVVEDVKSGVVVRAKDHFFPH